MFRFYVSDHEGDGLRYEVRVYPNRASFLRACHRRHRDEVDKTVGAATFHERRIWVFRDGSERLSKVKGLVCFEEGWVEPEIVAHEAVHVSLGIYRHRHRWSANFGNNRTDSSQDREEELARIVGRVTQGLMDGIRAGRKAVRRT